VCGQHKKRTAGIRAVLNEQSRTALYRVLRLRCFSMNGSARYSRATPQYAFFKKLMLFMGKEFGGLNPKKIIFYDSHLFQRNAANSEQRRVFRHS
jgi:1,4-alpha-glucan branching enzyme